MLWRRYYMSTMRFGDERDWFFEKRFGLFIHWGIYAIPAWQEQHQYRMGMPRDEYVKLVDEFNPVKFDPDEWLDHAENAGMEYITFTTKHVDGFCLWDTDQTDYNIMNTPYGKDVLAMLADACRQRDFPLCLYYSIPDMHNPNYPNQGRSYELPEPAPEDEPDQEKYLQFVKEQIRELCTRYGKIHGIWWDVNVIKHHDPSMNRMIRELQPAAVINNRGFDDGDFDTSERKWDKTADKLLMEFPRPRQGCDSIGHESWGYRKDEDYYSYRYIKSSIDRIMAKGGTYILNIGPMADGLFPSEGIDMLQNIGSWYTRVKESFLDTIPASGMTDNDEVLLTKKGNVLYVHQYQPLVKSGIVLAPIHELPQRATLLNTGEEIETGIDFLPSRFSEKRKYLHLRNLKVNDLCNTVPIIKLEFDNIPEREQGNDGQAK